MFSYLTNKQKDILISRYGLLGAENETLEQIGRRYSLTRERIRQIQSQTLRRLRNKLIPSISFDSIPRAFAESDSQKGLYLLSADICKIKYVPIEINDGKFFIEIESYKNFVKVKKYTRSLPKSIPYSEKLAKIKNYARTLDIPENLEKTYILDLKTKQDKTDYILEILANTGYPMHFTEVHKIMSKSCEIGVERNVLAIMQRRKDLFVRVSNGVYTIKNAENPKSVPFIKELIIEYMKQYKEGTPMDIYNYVAERRQCRYSSIPMFLTLNSDFKEVRGGVYSLRNKKKKETNVLCLDTIVNNLLSEEKQVPISKFITVAQHKRPEVSMVKLFEYLDNNTEIAVQDNFILKNNERNS